jgi:alpha-mannosidase
VTTAYVEGGKVLVRLFNAQGEAGPRRVALNRHLDRVELVELDGRRIKELPIERGGDGAGSAVTVSMDRFAVRTLRSSLA